MDIKHVFSINPLLPAYQRAAPRCAPAAPRCDWFELAGGLVEIGHDGDGFAFDNEGPRHKVWLEPFRLAARPVTCGEYRRLHRRWRLSPARILAVGRLGDGAARRAGRRRSIGARGRRLDDLHARGRRALDPGRAGLSCQLFTRPMPMRAGPASGCRPRPNGRSRRAGSSPAARRQFLDGRGVFIPRQPPPRTVAAARADDRRCLGMDASPYVAYPRFRAAAGAIGEYNGKFMCNQMVLRGGAAVTPAGHVRITYRNFFPPAARWAFAGLRLAEDVDEGRFGVSPFTISRRTRRVFATRCWTASRGAARRSRAAFSMTRAARRCSRRSASCRNII